MKRLFVVWLAALMYLLVVPVMAQETDGTQDSAIMERLQEVIDLYWQESMAEPDLLERLNAIIAEDPTLPEAYAYRASMHRKRHRFAAAHADVITGLDLAPNSGLLFSVQARIYSDEGDEKAAQTSIFNALAAVEKSAEIYYNAAQVTTNPATKEEFFARAIAMHPRPGFYGGRGVYYHANKRLIEALADFEKSIEIDPDYGGGYMGLANIYNEWGMFDDALMFYGLGIERGIENPGLYANRAGTYIRQQRWQEAVDDVFQAIAIDPEYAHAYANRGLLYYESKDYKNAIADYTTAITLMPDHADYYYNRGVIQQESNNIQAAIDDYTAALVIKPTYHQALLNRGALLSSRGDYQAALDDLNAALEIWPEFALAFYHRGIVLGSMDRHEDAVESYTRAIELSPSFGMAYYGRGYSYEQLGNAEPAQQDFARALELGYWPD